MRWGDRFLDFDSKTHVMGILNCTPDSFFPGSRGIALRDALKMVEGMVRAGADIIDVGGESTRPGSDPVAMEEEIRRVLPVVRAIRREHGVMLSLDTRKSGVAEQALDCGVDLINDVSGLKYDGKMAGLVAKRGVPVVLMHMRGDPKTMQKEPFYEDTMEEIAAELRDSISVALEAGVEGDRIIVDPGIGFGKRVEDNLRIIRDLAALKALQCPILVGLSRKGFIGQILDLPVERRLIGTVTAGTLAVWNGADILRVHDVEEAVAMAKIIDAVRRT